MSTCTGYTYSASKGEGTLPFLSIESTCSVKIQGVVCLYLFVSVSVGIPKSLHTAAVQGSVSLCF